MTTRTFRVAGTVVDAQAKKPVPGVRVEAWNNDTAQHVVLDTATVDAQGRFQLVMQAEVGAVGAGPSTRVITTVPVVIKIFQANQLLAATGDTSIPNLLTFNRAAALQVPAPPQPAKTDRVSAAQVLTAVTFAKRSDFMGVFNETRDRATSLGTVLMDSLKTAAGSFVLKPLQVSAVRSRDVIGQDQNTASLRLEQQNIAVGQVIQYQPGLTTSLNVTTSLPHNLKPGDKVNLLVQNGVVKGYQVVTATTGTVTGTVPPALTSEVNTLQANVEVLQTKTDDLEQFKTTQLASSAATSTEVTALQQKAALVDQLQTQLASVQQDSAQKTQTISALQKQLADVQTAHNALAAELAPARIAALEDAVRKLQQGGH